MFAHWQQSAAGASQNVYCHFGFHSLDRTESLNNEEK